MHSRRLAHYPIAIEPVVRIDERRRMPPSRHPLPALLPMVNRRSFLAATATAAAALSFKQLYARPQRPAGRRPRIILRSGWKVSNIGDIGHTPGTLAVIERHLPDADVTVWAAHIDETVEAMLRRRFPRFDFVRGQLYDKDRGLEGPLAEAFAEADFYMLNSGMMMNYGFFNYDWNGPVYNLMPMIHCIEHGIPFGIYGQSADKFAFPSLSLFRPVLEHAAFFYARDGESVDYLRACEIQPEVLDFGPDGCFGIDVRDDARADSFLAAEGLEPGKFLALVIRTNSGSVKGDPLNPADPDRIQQEENERWMSVCARVVEAWIQATELPVLLCPEAEKEIEGARRFLLPRLPATVSKHVRLRGSFWNADEAVSVYSRARAVFGVEPHSLIMALTSGVPIVHARPLRHGRKGWMFRDIGLGDWLFNIDQADPATIAATVVAHHTDHERATARAKAAMEVVRRHQRAGMAVLAAQLGITSV